MAALEAEGFKPWFDQDRMAGGDHLVAEINQGLKESDAGVIVFSASTAESHWVRAEVGYLLYAWIEYEKPLVPVIVDDGANFPALIQPLFEGLPGAVVTGRSQFLDWQPVGTRRDQLAAIRSIREQKLADLGHALRDVFLPGLAATALAELGDGTEAVRNHMAGQDFDSATNIARACIAALGRFRQSAGIAALASEILESLPLDAGDYSVIAEEEATAHLGLGWTERAMQRYESLLQLHQQRVQAEPDRTDYQRDLSVSFERFGDIHLESEEYQSAIKSFEAALAVRE